MSLINEALKKVQNQQTQPGSPITSDPPTPPPGMPAQPQGPGRHRNFLWGFILSVLVVGLFTTLLTTFFVYLFLGEEEKVSPDSVSQTVQTSTQEMTPPTKPEAEPDRTAFQPDPPAKETSTAIPYPDGAVTAPPSEAAAPPPVEAVVVAASSTVLPPQTASPPQQAGTETRPIHEPAASSLNAPPNPAIISRLQELEIRGIMSGGVKVLIHDQATGLTRAYRIEEAMGGPMGLVIADITPSTIQFRDYAGTIHTKSF